MTDYRTRIFQNKLLSSHRQFKNGVYDRKHQLLSEYKEALFGNPPVIKNGKVVPGTGSMPDMELIDRFFLIEVV